jgi:hypothetical protein
VTILAAGSARKSGAFTRPADERDGVRAQACQVGDDVQILEHNGNTYSVNVDTRTTYIDEDGLHVKSSSEKIAANYGSQIDLIQVRTVMRLAQITLTLAVIATTAMAQTR